MFYESEIVVATPLLDRPNGLDDPQASKPSHLNQTSQHQAPSSEALEDAGGRATRPLLSRSFAYDEPIMCLGRAGLTEHVCLIKSDDLDRYVTHARTGAGSDWRHHFAGILLYSDQAL